MPDQTLTVRSPWYRILYVQVLVAVALSIDRFMSECRAITHFIGNGVATVVISRLENELSVETLNENLRARRA
ncbi:hypothetical protein HQ447_06610 [bacterium]|nr:hypothetical protein [bacterium]